MISTEFNVIDRIQASTFKSVTLRALRPQDMPSVYDIEDESFHSPWGKKDFRRCLKHPKCLSIAACDPDTGCILGFAVLDLSSKEFAYLLNLAIREDQRRRSIGRQVMESLQSGMANTQKKCIRVYVEERNLIAQMFLKELKFQAIEILTGFYMDSDDDCYVLQYRKR